MLGTLVTRLIELATPTAVTEVFLWVITALLLFAFYEAVRNRHSRFLEHSPNLMTSVGILGTFTGVVIGLLDFNPRDIDGSITTLLDGLKTAFITSLYGMAAAIFFKAADSFYFAPLRERIAALAEDDVPDDVQASDIYKILSEQKAAADETLKFTKGLYQQQHKTAQLAEKTHQALAGQEEGSLVGQSKLLRADIGDLGKQVQRRHDEFAERLWGEFKNFAELLSKSASEQIVAALRDVLQDFNQKVAEHIGDNFKALNEAVGRLLQWQETYKQQLSSMMTQYEQGVTAIDQTRDSVAHIGVKAAEIPVAMERLREVLEVNQHQIQELSRHLEAFVLMRDRAVEAVPEVQARIDEITASVKANSERLTGALESSAESLVTGVQAANASMISLADGVREKTEETSTVLGDAMKDVRDSAITMVKDLGEGATQVQRQIAQHSEQLGLAAQEANAAMGRTAQGIQEQLRGILEQQARDMGQALDRNADSVRAAVEETVRKTGDMSEQATRTMAENVNEQVRIMNQAMEREIGRAMRILGETLGGIALEIANQYQRMAEQRDRR